MLYSPVERKRCPIKSTDYNQDTFCKIVFMEMFLRLHKQH